MLAQHLEHLFAKMKAEQARTSNEESDLVFAVGVLIEDCLLYTSAQTIGPYRVIREVGKGGMGAVYEADVYKRQVSVCRCSLVDHSAVSRW